jgi:hypothetical protein
MKWWQFGLRHPGLMRHPGLYVDVDNEGHRYCICGRGQAGHIRRGFVLWKRG